MFVADPPARPPGERDLPDLPIEQVEEEICTLAARIAAGTCRYLECVAEFDRRDGWWRWPGVRSMADWLAWRCALTPRAAREHVRVARALGGFRRSARRVSAQEAANSHERAHCLWGWGADGSLYLNALLPAEEGAALLEALEAARSELARRRWEEAREEEEEQARAGEGAGGEGPETALRGSAEPRSDGLEGASAEEGRKPPRAYRRPANHECLAYIAEQAVAHGPGRSSPAEAYQVTVHVDAARLVASSGEGACHLQDGPAVSSATARRVAWG